MRLVARLLLAGCLLLQLAGTVWACEHDIDSTDCHHCCHDADMPAGDGECGPGCLHCVAHGQSWSTAAVNPAHPLPDSGGYWRSSQIGGPLPRFADRLFRPPIPLPIS